MKIRGTWLIAIAIAALGFSAKADSLVGSGAWQNWSAATLGSPNMPTYGGPYWNNFSGDGNNANIGWCMTGGGGCAISSPPGAVQYYGNSNNAVQNMSYQATGVPVTVSLLGAVTNQKGVNGSGIDYFGWYAINSNGTLGATHSLWNSTSAVNSTSATFAPTGHYGFYFENVQSPGKSYEADYFWFMNSGFDYATGTGTVDTGVQHFSVFNSDPNGVFYMGLEDQRGGGDLDYNDMIIKVVSVTPEPASLGLLLAGVSTFGLIVRKRKQQ